MCQLCGIPSLDAPCSGRHWEPYPSVLTLLNAVLLGLAVGLFLMLYALGTLLVVVLQWCACGRLQAFCSSMSAEISRVNCNRVNTPNSSMLSDRRFSEQDRAERATCVLEALTLLNLWLDVLWLLFLFFLLLFFLLIISTLVTTLG